jgi:hypothetical protein
MGNNATIGRPLIPLSYLNVRPFAVRINVSVELIVRLVKFITRVSRREMTGSRAWHPPKAVTFNRNKDMENIESLIYSFYSFKRKTFIGLLQQMCEN